jgi:hypothetical protein
MKVWKKGDSNVQRHSQSVIDAVKAKSRDMRWAGHITGIHAATSGINMNYWCILKVLY